MSFKRSSSVSGSQIKKLKTSEASYFHETLQKSGLTMKHPPDKCIAAYAVKQLFRNIKNTLQNHIYYPQNVTDIFTDLENECKDFNIFKHYLYPNIVRITENSPDEHFINDSVFKILLSVPILQDKLIDFIFGKAIDLAAESKCGPWIQMILKCFSSFDSVINTEKLSTQLIDLLDVASEKMVRVKIITAIPDIIGDKEHSNIAAEMSRILNEDNYLIPAILDCLSYLCLSDEQYEQLQKKTLHILSNFSKWAYFSNFVKFCLMPGRMSDDAYLETVLGLRNALGWPTTVATPQEIATSQVLTAKAIRSSMTSSKVIANLWLKTVANCKVHTDHKPIDFIILIIYSSISEEKHRQVENLLKKQIQLNALKEDLIDECFQKFKPILKDYLKNLIDLANTMLENKADPMIESFASHIYTLMFSELEECCQTVVAELLQVGLNRKKCALNTLLILNKVASKDMSLLKPQSIQMLTLLDRKHDMNLVEIRSVMNLLCGLAYSYENSVLRDDIHMIIRKELSNSSPKIKVQGIVAGIHAIKYLMANGDNDHTAELPDDVSYSSVTYLSEGDLRDAAHIIESISRSTKQIPDMIAFFYDELSQIIVSASYINKQFLSWLTDAVTNDLQQNFIVDAIQKEQMGELKLSMQYCLNEDSEMDEVIAINIAGLTLQSKSEINVIILSPLFQLVQTLHSKQHDGNLSNIDALLGCPVVMPIFDIDLVEDMESSTVTSILDCLVHCVNWFRELINAFAIQDDVALKIKTFNRVIQIEELEKNIGEIILKSKIAYKPPVSTFNINKYTGENEKTVLKTKAVKQKVQKKAAQDDTVIPETGRSLGTQANQNPIKNKLDLIQNIPLRPLNLNLLHLFKTELGSDGEDETGLTIRTLKFLLKCVNCNLEKTLISKIKRKTFLSKPDDNFSYDPKKAEDDAKSVSEVLPKIVEHLTFVISFLDTHIPENEQDEKEFIFTIEIMDHITCLEYIYNFYTIFFKWVGFKNHHNALLKSSLRTIASTENVNIVSLKELVLAVAKYIQKHEKYCLQLSTAVALMDFLKAIQEYTDNKVVLKILRDMSHNFLSKQWKTPDGIAEKGFIYNQSIDRFASIYFINNEILALKNLSLQLTNDIKSLKGRNDVLNSFKCINKSNFAILYRNFGTSVYEATRTRLNKGLTNSEHLDLWKDVAVILKHMSDIVKTLENRNNLSAFFKKSLPILKIFLTQGVPILEIQLKTEAEEVLEIFKILQQSTRFLQSLCCHSRIQKDSVLMSKAPYMRQLLETLVYKVKGALASNKCSGAFWMGNLKNKDIHGEVLATQQSIASEESTEDADEQLPEDDDSDDTDDEVLNPDSKSISDIV